MSHIDRVYLWSIMLMASHIDERPSTVGAVLIQNEAKVAMIFQDDDTRSMLESSLRYEAAGRFWHGGVDGGWNICWRGSPV